jgi:hypothetical protein
MKHAESFATRRLAVLEQVIVEAEIKYLPYGAALASGAGAPPTTRSPVQHDDLLFPPTTHSSHITFLLIFTNGSCIAQGSFAVLLHNLSHF